MLFIVWRVVLKVNNKFNMLTKVSNDKRQRKVKNEQDGKVLERQLETF
jgi:hypothetical protein